MRLVLQRIGAAEDGPHGQAERQRRANPSRHTQPLHRIDGRIERIEEQKSERERREQRLHVLQEKHDDAERDDDERDGTGVEPVERPHFTRWVGCARRAFDSLCSDVIQFPAQCR